MARTLLDILNGPFPKAQARTANETPGLTPLPQETGARAFLKTLKVQAQPDPFGNDDSFSAKDVSVFDRAKNHFGYDYKTQGDYNNQGSPNYHVLRNPTLNVSTEETVFEAVDSVGLGSRTAWRVVNKLTKEYVTRSINKEEAEKIASDLNAELVQHILDEGKEEQDAIARRAKRRKNLRAIKTNRLTRDERENEARAKRDADAGAKWRKSAHAKNIGASLHKEEAEKIASDLNAELVQHILDEDKGKGSYKNYKKVTAPNGQKIWKRKKTAKLMKDKESIKEETLDESVSRKHFREVANTVRSIEDPGKRQEFADHHASIFKGQNPRFSHDKFHAACGTKTKRERGLHTSMGEDVEQIDETPMPKSVLQHKTKIQNMGHDERKKYFAGKSVARLKSMAWRNGHGKDSDAYSKYHDGITKEETRSPKRLSEIMEGWAKKVNNR